MRAGQVKEDMATNRLENQSEVLTMPQGQLSCQLIPHLHCGAEWWRSPPPHHHGAPELKTVQAADVCQEMEQHTLLELLSGYYETVINRVKEWELRVQEEDVPFSSASLSEPLRCVSVSLQGLPHCFEVPGVTQAFSSDKQQQPGCICKLYICSQCY